MTQRKWNFNGGPAALPEDVLKLASEAVIEYEGSGLSILELPHRGKHFDAILQESYALVRELCGLGNDYEILWMHGGGRQQFCMIPANFIGRTGTAGYIDSGHWADEAQEYAAYYGEADVLASSADSNYAHLPQWPEEEPIGLSYIHMTTNNTIYGTQWPEIPRTTVPLIADMSSDIMSMQRDYTRCALFYAAAQKNIGPAGATLVCIRKDLAETIAPGIPPMLDYSAHIKANGVLNTSPVFPIYCSLLMLRWTKQKGIAAIEQDNRKKAQILYTEIERNPIFTPVVDNVHDRSLMNVCFRAVDKQHEDAFLKYCDQHNITGVKGHRSVGGFRASLYNAVSLEAVQHLVRAMQGYEQQAGK